MKELSRTGQFDPIRRGTRDEGLLIRALATKDEVHRRTVGKAQADPTPPSKFPKREAPVLGQSTWPRYVFG